MKRLTRGWNSICWRAMIQTTMRTGEKVLVLEGYSSTITRITSSCGFSRSVFSTRIRRTRLLTKEWRNGQRWPLRGLAKERLLESKIRRPSLLHCGSASSVTSEEMRTTCDGRKLQQLPDRVQCSSNRRAHHASK